MATGWSIVALLRLGRPNARLLIRRLRVDHGFQLCIGTGARAFTERIEGYLSGWDTCCRGDIS